MLPNVIDVAVTPTSVAPPLPPGGAALLEAPVVPPPLPPPVVLPPPLPPPPVPADASSPVVPPPVLRSDPPVPPPDPPPPPPVPPDRRASPICALFARDPHPAASSASTVTSARPAIHRRRPVAARLPNVVGVLTVPLSTRPSGAERRPLSHDPSGRE